MGTETPTVERVLYPNNYGPVRVRVYVRASHVSVEAYCLPGFGWWSCPDSATLRRMVDQALRGTGRKRTATRTEWRPFSVGWQFFYETS